MFSVLVNKDCAKLSVNEFRLCTEGVQDLVVRWVNAQEAVPQSALDRVSDYRRRKR